MGSSTSSGRRWWRHGIAGVAAVSLATPFVTAAALSAPAGQPGGRAVLLSVAGEDLAAVTADVTRSGGRVLHSFPVAAALEVSLPAGVAPPTGAVVVPDQQFTFNAAGSEASSAPVNTYRDTIGDVDGADGSGVTVALVDTGVADTGEVAVTHVNVSGGPQGDGYGHGTFLAGLIAGNGASSDGAYQGVAPAARILDVQVAQPDGSTSLTQVLAGLQAVADRQAVDPSVKVVELALSTGSPLPPWLDPLTRGLESLWARGMTVVVAAGNDGAASISSPASDPTLLAVGATDEMKTPTPADDRVADFSAHDETFGVDRPDVVAPGVSLVSLRAPGSVADSENPNSVVQDTYFKGTGTSMSSAVTAGAAASLVSARGPLDPNDVKRLLIGTAFDSKSLKKKNGAGAGEVDLSAALATKVSDTPKLRTQLPVTPFFPAEEDAATWQQFGQAWEAGDFRAVVAAWIQLSPQTRRWAATAWGLSVLSRAFSMDEGDFAARRWVARRWVTQAWDARRWADDDWVARRWVGIDWSARRWVDGGWVARRWVADDWLAFAWALRVDAADPTISDLWQDEDFDARRWVARRWVSTDWVARRWVDEAWDARRWVGYTWDARRWVDKSWDARRWVAGEWDARRWVDFTYEARRWVTEDWTARRWSVTGWGL